MAYVDVSRNICGFLSMEEGNGKLTTRFFRLNQQTCLLEYFLENHKTDTSDDSSYSGVIGSFDIHFLSIAADASTIRPKIPHCFYIMVLGERHFLSASSEEEKRNWIQILQESSKIEVPASNGVSAPGDRNGFRVEIVGGIALKTPLEDIHDEDNQPPVSSTVWCNDNYIKIGYCVKQGGVRKNWKRRYFVLDYYGLAYYATSLDRIPIKIIKLRDIKQVRLSIGIHLHKQNIFEVVTPLRVFYIQASTSAERDAWIKAISNCIDSQQYKHKDIATQTNQLDTSPDREAIRGPLTPQPNQGRLSKMRLFRVTSV